MHLHRPISAGHGGVSTARVASSWLPGSALRTMFMNLIKIIENVKGAARKLSYDTAYCASPASRNARLRSW